MIGRRSYRAITIILETTTTQAWGVESYFVTKPAHSRSDGLLHDLQRPDATIVDG